MKLLSDLHELEGLQKWKKERLDIAGFPILTFVLDQHVRTGINVSRRGVLHREVSSALRAAVE